MDPKRLAEMRRARLRLGVKDESYANVDFIKRELKFAQSLYSETTWPVIDVTGKSVEELSQEVLDAMIDHDAFNPNTAQIDDFKARYREGTIGDVEVKMALAEALNNFLDPIREKRAYYEQNMNLVEEAIMSGVSRMRVIAAETMEQVRDAMRISSYTKNWK